MSTSRGVMGQGEGEMTVTGWLFIAQTIFGQKHNSNRPEET